MFLAQVWDYLGLPSPTAVQNDIAYNLQHGPRRLIIQAFRGIGKSWITVAFVLWLLLLNPQIQVLVVSANEKLSKSFVKFSRQLINGMEILQHLKPRQGQTDSADAFDVGPAHDMKGSSVRSAGITGQITGDRADVVVADDIEVPKNSHTHVLRERISELVKEFDAVLKPGGRVVYLGTPQVEQSLYNRLLSRGYQTLVWPVRIPIKLEIYAGRLARFITRLIEKGVAVFTPIEPTRFHEDEIQERMASYGMSGFELQFMLNTVPSDADKNPLKTKDLIIHDVDERMGHVSLVWGNDRDQIIQTLQSGGFDGDFYARSAWKSEHMVPFQGTVCAIDPSGKGSDETSYAIIRYLNGWLYLVACGGFTDGFGEVTLRSLASLMVRHRVNYWVAEENFGGGMFAQLLKPVISQVAEEMRLDTKDPDPNARPSSFDEDFDGWSSTQKEARILDTLEPLIKQHRLVVDRRVIEADLLQQGDKERYSLVQQMTRMSRIKGCLPNEDRLEAVSMACSYWTQRMSRNTKKVESDHKSNLLDIELKKFMDASVRVSPGHDGTRSSPSQDRWRQTR